MIVDITLGVHFFDFEFLKGKIQEGVCRLRSKSPVSVFFVDDPAKGRIGSVFTVPQIAVAATDDPAVQKDSKFKVCLIQGSSF